MKTRWMNLIAGFAIFVLCISICTTTANATVIWEDNFDEDLEGWTFFGYRDDGTGNWSVRVEEDNFSAEGGMLTVLDDDVNVARHNSTANVGTWSFDLYIPETDSGCIDVVIMSDGGRPGFDNPGGSGSVFTGNWVALEAYADVDYFIFWYAEEGEMSNFAYWTIYSYGWHHFDISRTSDGYYRLWLNGNQKAFPATNDVTSSDYLEIWCWNATGWAIDNIVARNVPITTIPPTSPTPTTPTPTPTPTTPPLPWELIVIGGGAAVVVIVLAIVLLRRK